MCPCNAVCAVPGGSSPQSASISCAPGDLPAVEEQRCEQRALLRPRGREVAITIDDREGTEDLELHLRPILARVCRESGTR